jgi:colanic acid biosynthesis glycosyl transferase WcaI
LVDASQKRQESGRMRVVIYGINYSPEPIGVGRYTGEIGQALTEQGHDLRVVTAVPHYPGWRVQAPFGNRWSFDGAAVFRCPLLLKAGMRGIWRFLAPLSFALTSAPVALYQILRFRPQVILCVEPTLMTAPLAVLAGRLVGARLVLHVHDLEVDAAFSVGHLRSPRALRLAHALERRILAAFDRLITISETMRAKLLDKGLAADRVAIVRNWVDLERIAPLREASGYRGELGLTADQFVVLYAGSIGAKQALDIVLDLAERIPEARFVVAGDGPAKAALVDRYGSLANVHFLPLAAESRLGELLGLADLHVLPQDAKAADLVLPSKLGGMLASGKPVAVMADAGTELHDFLAGAAILVAAGDRDGLEAAIRDLMAHGDRIGAATRLARAAVLGRSDNLGRLLALLTVNHRETEGCR